MSTPTPQDVTALSKGQWLLNVLAWCGSVIVSCCPCAAVQGGRQGSRLQQGISATNGINHIKMHREITEIVAREKENGYLSQYSTYTFQI